MHQHRGVLHFYPKPYDAAGESDICSYQSVLGQIIQGLDYARRVSFFETPPPYE